MILSYVITAVEPTCWQTYSSWDISFRNHGNSVPYFPRRTHVWFLLSHPKLLSCNNAAWTHPQILSPKLLVAFLLVCHAIPFVVLKSLLSNSTEKAVAFSCKSVTCMFNNACLPRPCPNSVIIKSSTNSFFVSFNAYFFSTGIDLYVSCLLSLSLIWWYVKWTEVIRAIHYWLFLTSSHHTNTKVVSIIVWAESILSCHERGEKSHLWSYIHNTTLVINPLYLTNFCKSSKRESFCHIKVNRLLCSCFTVMYQRLHHDD